MHKSYASLMWATPILLASACSDDPQPAEPTDSGSQEISAADSPSAFLPKDMDWLPEDIWLPSDFEPTQSQKMNPMAETYLLRGNTQMSTAALLSSYEERLAAAGYEPFPVKRPKPDSITFSGNGHGYVIVNVSDEGTKRVMTLSVENATGF